MQWPQNVISNIALAYEDKYTFGIQVYTHFFWREKGEGKGRQLLGGMYNLEEGKVHCQCLRRKWKFCQEIKTLAGARLAPSLLVTRSIKEIKDGREGRGKEGDRREGERGGIVEGVKGFRQTWRGMEGREEQYQVDKLEGKGDP